MRTIPVGAVAVSDAASFVVQPNTNYAATIYTPSTTGAGTSHYFSSHYSYAALGDQVSATTMSGVFNLGLSVFFVSGLDVSVAGKARGIVAIGDSITDDDLARTPPWSRAASRVYSSIGPRPISSR